MSNIRHTDHHDCLLHAIANAYPWALVYTTHLSVLCTFWMESRCQTVPPDTNRWQTRHAHEKPLVMCSCVIWCQVLPCCCCQWLVITWKSVLPKLPIMTEAPLMTPNGIDLSALCYGMKFVLDVKSGGSVGVCFRIDGIYAFVPLIVVSI